MPKCPCLRPEDPEVHVLDYRHCSLEHMPAEVFLWERTLEELYVDANQIRDLPRVSTCSLTPSLLVSLCHSYVHIFIWEHIWEKGPIGN